MEDALAVAGAEAQMLGSEVAGHAHPFVGLGDPSHLRNIIGNRKSVQDFLYAHRSIVRFGPDRVIGLLIDVHDFPSVAIADGFGRHTTHVYHVNGAGFPASIGIGKKAGL